MRTSQTHYTSFFGSLFFAVFAFFLFFIAGVLGLSALVVSVYGSQIDIPATILFVTFGFTGSLLATAAVISFMKFTNNASVEIETSTSFSNLKIGLSVIAIALVLLAGHLLQDNMSINWLALPLLTIPAVAVPIWLFIRLSARDLQLGSRWRVWSTFGLSMSLTPLLVFVIEIVVIIFVIIVFAVYVMANPAFAEELQALSRQYAMAGPNSKEALRLLLPYIEKPSVFISAVFLLSVVVPVLEEAFKPLAVWLVAGKLTSKAQGFVLGAISGAGFALVETFNNSAQAEEWASILFARIGTGAMHITTSALIGAAIFSAWHERKYIRLLGTYLLGIFLHGLWNFLAVTNGFSILLAEYQNAGYYQNIATISMVGLIILAVVLITILVASNRKQAKALIPETLSTPSIDESNADI